MQDLTDLGTSLDADPTQAVPSARLTDLVHNALRDRIGGGQYPRRTRLPSERELAGEFDVSRPVVRAALARLRDAGLVESIKGSGTIVLREPTSRPNLAPAGATVRDLQRCFEFRLLIEGEAALFAARRAPAGMLDQIREGLDVVDEAIARGGERRGQSFDFHRSVARASDNSYYVSALDMMSSEPAFRIYLRRSVGVPSAGAHVAKVAGEHRHIFELIERREAEEARMAMRAHIESARDNFMECLPLGDPFPET